MSDLIDRQAAIDEIRTMQTYKLFAGDDMLLVDQAEAVTNLMVLPTAEPRKGKWKEVQVVIGRDGDFTMKEYECEICGYRQYFPENYCGRCGTRMEESDG